MKKIICVLIALITVLTACSNEKPVPEESLPLSESSQSTSQSELIPAGINPEDYDTVEEYDGFYILSNQTGKTRPTIMESALPTAYLSETAETEVWFLSKDGKLLNEEPYEYYEWFVNYLAGFRNGGYDLYEINESGEISFYQNITEKNDEVFGYTIFRYHWFVQTVHYGVLAPDGSVFAEPVYCYADVPFSDRIVLQSGSSDCFGGRICRIFDEDGNIINESFNDIFYNTRSCSDGYIGLAYCADPEDIDTTVICKDKDGNPMEYGWYFVDKDGNIIDGPFKNIIINLIIQFLFQ